jgi:hypothetical protein
MSERRPKTEAELVELVRAVDVRAPEPLRRSVEEMVAARTRPRGARDRAGAGRARRPLALAAVLAVVAAVLAVALLAGGSSAPAGPSLSEAAALTLAPATRPAPPESPNHRAQLAAAVDGVSFPYWEGRLGWSAAGSRSDRLHGRQVTTVFYGDGGGRQIGYAIVSGRPAPKVSGATTVWRNGIPYRLRRENGVAVVTWLRSGHMCVVSGRGVDAATLLRLASWDSRGQVAS